MSKLDKTLRKPLLAIFCKSSGLTVREAASQVGMDLNAAHSYTSIMVQDKRLKRLAKARCNTTNRKVVRMQPTILGRVENLLGQFHPVTQFVARVVGA